MKASIVVGLGWGDEGKGITTDYLSVRSSNPIVVRFSGGQQAGHTVRVGGTKHTFSNFGAGTLRGVPTYFSEHTTIYPVTMHREYKILKEKGFEPRLIIHPLAKLTTPFDVYANRNCEDNMEHGTCGLGVGKTMKRHTESPVQIYAMDLLNTEVLIDKLTSVAAWYGYDPESKVIIDWVDKEGMLFAEAINETPFEIQSYNFLKRYDNIIFEGSQGILLDMNHGVFPYVTFSNTTSKNAQEICDKLGIEDRTVYGVTRAYHTRHGNGPFEEKPIDIINNDDENNQYNEYQLRFKVAPMNYDLLHHALRIENNYSEGCKKVLVVTCNDQVSDLNKFDLTKVYVTFNNFIKSYSSDSKDMRESIKE